MQVRLEVSSPESELLVAACGFMVRYLSPGDLSLAWLLLHLAGLERSLSERRDLDEPGWWLAHHLLSASSQACGHYAGSGNHLASWIVGIAALAAAVRIMMLRI